MEKKLGANAVPIVIPLGKERDFRGVIDLIELKAYVYDDPKGKNVDIQEIPQEHKEIAAKYRNIMIERIAAEDETLMKRFLEAPDTINEIHQEEKDFSAIFDLNLEIEDYRQKLEDSLKDSNLGLIQKRNLIRKKVQEFTMQKRKGYLK